MGFNSAFKGLILRHVLALTVVHLQGAHKLFGLCSLSTHD